MSKRYIISLMAANRVGIVAAMTTALDELGGDLHEVSQTVMQKFFTIILAADFPDQRSPDIIVDHLRDVCRPYGIKISLKDPEQEQLQPDPSEGTEKYFVTVSGEDQPGIIRCISTRLARDSVDITDLYAKRNHENSFLMIMELSVPPGVDPFLLQRDLEEIGSAVGLAATLQHESIFVATHDTNPVKLVPSRPHFPR